MLDWVFRLAVVGFIPLFAYGCFGLTRGAVGNDWPPLVGALALIGLPAVSILAGIALYRAMVPQPSPLNACHTCSYDLTGNESGVCPECGTKTGTPAREPES